MMKSNFQFRGVVKTALGSFLSLVYITPHKPNLKCAEFIKYVCLLILSTSLYSYYINPNKNRALSKKKKPHFSKEFVGLDGSTNGDGVEGVAYSQNLILSKQNPVLNDSSALFPPS